MDLADYVSGGHQDEYEYRSFRPNPIHHPWIISDPDIQLLLGAADRALGELNAFAQLIPDIEFFQPAIARHPCHIDARCAG